jgi:uncharacterized OsmC-like protein
MKGVLGTWEDRRDIKQKAPAGAGTRSVTLTMTHGPRCEIAVPGGHVIVTDEAKERGGDNAGASPLAHLTAALASCQAVQVHKVAKAMRFNHGRVTITCTTTTDRVPAIDGGDKVMRFIAAALAIEVETDEPEARLDRLAKLSEDSCPVGNLFADAGTTPVITWTALPLKG